MVEEKESGLPEKQPPEPYSIVGGGITFTFLNSSFLWEMACEMRDEAAWVEMCPTGMSSRAVISVILSAATTEAFINELVAEVWKARESLSPILVGFGQVMREIEDNRGTVGLKYLVASQALSGQMFDKGAAPFQDFDLLRKVRDSLMHIKLPDILSEPSSSSSRRPEIIMALRQKKLTYPLGRDDQTPWFNELQTYKLAAWACDGAEHDPGGVDPDPRRSGGPFGPVQACVSRRRRKEEMRAGSPI